MRVSNIHIVLLTLAPLSAAAQSFPVINEIMYAPPQGKSEWIEIHNPTSKSFDLKDWVLHDATAARNVISKEIMVIESGAYLVIAPDSSFLKDYSLFEGKLAVMKGFPTLNNSGDDISLLTPSTERADFVCYRSSWGGGGASLERIDPNSDGNNEGNWSTCVTTERATPGKRNSIAKAKLDLSIESLEIDPPRPRAGNAALVRISVRNAGLATASDFFVTLYESALSDSALHHVELISSIRYETDLRAGDLAPVSGILPPSDRMLRRITAVLEYSGDENAGNDTGRMVFRYSLPHGSVIINEIMYAPVSGEPEWVELLNTSSVNVCVSGWSIGDEATTREFGASETLTIPPHGFCVIAGSSAISSRYPSMPVTPIVVSLPSLNNSGDEVRLLDDACVTIDSVRYFAWWGGSDGRSLERIDARKPAGDAINWTTCEAVLPGTPGEANSARVRDRDLAVRSMAVSGNDVAVLVVNKGLLSSPPVLLVLFIDKNGDGAASADEEAARKTVPILPPADSCEILIPSALTQAGLARLIAWVDYGEDERPSDNILSIETVRPAENGVLTINEIMYSPLSGDAEWLEYYNPSSTSVNIAGYRIARAKGKDGIRPILTLPASPVVVSSGGYLVIASDSSIFARFPELPVVFDSVSVLILNRSSLGLTEQGELLLTDAAGVLVDSVSYSSSWHNPNITDFRGRSMERLNPEFSSALRENWSTCPEIRGGTPGRRNALFTDRTPWESREKLRLEARPNPFSPDGDGFEDHCVVSWELPGTVSQIRLRVFDSIGRKVRTLASNQASGGLGRLIFDGLDDQNRKLPVGIYILLLESVDFNGSSTASAKATVVVATRL